MKPLRSIPVLLLLLSALTVLSGCARKKPVMVVVPQEQPATTAPTPAPTPAVTATTQPTQSEPVAQPAGPPAPSPEEAARESTEKTAKKSHQHHGILKKPSPVVKAEAAPPDLRPEPRSTPAPISPSISPTDAQRDNNSTEQLLQATENNLNNIRRQLSQQEEGMVAQVRSFINQSRQATKDNDPARARNLAVKANLLSNELIRR